MISHRLIPITLLLVIQRLPLIFQLMILKQGSQATTFPYPMDHNYPTSYLFQAVFSSIPAGLIFIINTHQTGFCAVKW